jgi:hypothetical protein
MEALFPEVDFALYIQRARNEGKGPSSRGLVRLARTYVESTQWAGNGEDRFGRVARGLQCLAQAGKRFSSLYIGPP